MGWLVNTTTRLIYPRERDPVPNIQEAKWAPISVSRGAEYLAPTGIQSADRAARSD